MNLIDLRLPKKSKKELSKTMVMDQPKFPYGFQLRFDSEQVEKFPQLKDVKKGAKFLVKGVGEVTGWDKSDRQGGKENYSVEIQLQKVALSSASTKSDTLIGAIEKSKNGKLK